MDGVAKQRQRTKGILKQDKTMKCTEKQPFETRAEAYRFTQYMIHHQRKIRLYIYECPYCGKYHVTHKKQNFKRAESKTKTGNKKHIQYYATYRE